MRSFTVAFAAALVLLTSCGAGNASALPGTPSASTASETTAVTSETAGTTNTLEKKVFFSVGDPITDEMYSRALMNAGDRSRLAAAMKKARSGEAVTVGVIGGSITQGTAASSGAKCYASLFFDWWQEKFPECEVRTVNAGIGGTNSYLGVNRVDEQLLAYEPDVVIVEFSVNDTDRIMNKYSYDSLVRRILSYHTDPAVILLFTTQENGTSMQDTHLEIGKAYDLPCISYRDAILPEIAACAIEWRDISPDNIHPNDEGHSVIGQLLSRYLDGVYYELDSIDTAAKPFDMPAATNDYYKESRLLCPSDIEASGDLTVGTNKVYPGLFPENWVLENGGDMSFEIDCSVLGVFYLKTTDGSGGKYEVFLDGQRRAVIDSDFRGGWGNYGETKQILFGEESAHHTVEIKPLEGQEDRSITVLGIMAG